jgi:hypothetical protein
LDDPGDPDGLFPCTDEVACCVRVLPFVVAPLWALPGSLGHDFSPEPLLRYSFIEIECPIEIFAWRQKERDGRKWFRLVKLMSRERLWNSDYNR